MEQIRLQKFLADSGIASRRKCEQYILEGLVSVNGKIITELGTKVNPDEDKISYKGKIVKPNQEYIYVLLNKPLGYITTAKEQFGRPMVMDLINVSARLVPVGRLDMYTSGALILTNDGQTVNKITHPKNHIKKTYIVITKGIPAEEELQMLRKGIEIEDYTTKEAKVVILEKDDKKNTAKVEIAIYEGKNRQVRRMFDIIEKPVISIHRSKIGNIDVQNLKLGQYRILKKEEIEGLWMNKK